MTDRIENEYKITSRDIEAALCAYPSSPFYCRRWIAVARASWGIESHECDILALSASNYAHEIEIKISVSDLKKDFQKSHSHISIDNKIRCLWFAAPETMLEAMKEFVPVNAGIIIVRTIANHCRARIIRKAAPKKTARKFTEDEKLQLLRLGAMRYWSTIRSSK